MSVRGMSGGDSSRTEKRWCDRSRTTGACKLKFDYSSIIGDAASYGRLRKPFSEHI